MRKIDVKYRDRVLLREARKQAKDVQKAVTARVLNPLLRELRREENLNEQTVVALINNIVQRSGVAERVTQIRKKHDKTKLFGKKYLEELERLRKRYAKE